MSECETCYGERVIVSHVLCGTRHCSCDGFSGGCTVEYQCGDCDGMGSHNMGEPTRAVELSQIEWRYIRDRLTGVDPEPWVAGPALDAIERVLGGGRS